jgi:3-deoxy-D-manno-octulosonic acid kinase
MMTAVTIETALQPAGDGVILFDRAALAQFGVRSFDPGWFDPAHWRARDRATGLSGGRGGVVRVRLDAGDWVVRHYHRGGMIARLLGDRYLWKGAERTRGFAEFRLLAELARRGLNVPLPVAARFRREGVQYRADLITRYIAGAKTLAGRVAEETFDADTASRVGQGIAEFHAAGAYHADLNAHNVLVDARQIWLVDFDRGELRKPQRAWQLANLARLRRSLIKLGAAREGEQIFEARIWQPLMAAYERALGQGGVRAVAGRSEA